MIDVSVTNNDRIDAFAVVGKSRFRSINALIAATVKEAAIE